MRELEITHVYRCSPDTFWNQLFFREDFAQYVYVENMGFRSWSLERTEERDGRVHRQVRLVKPLPASIPGAFRAVVGDVITYVERGEFDPVSRRYSLTLTTEASDRGQVRGEITVEPHPDGCLRRLKLTAEVNIPVVGGRAERGLIDSFSEGYRDAMPHANRFLEEHGLGHGM